MSRKIIIAVAALLSAAVISAAVIISQPAFLKNIFGSDSHTAAPDELLSQYFAYLESGQYEEMFDLLTLQSRATISKDDFVTKNRNIYGGIEARNIDLTIVEVTEDKSGRSSDTSDAPRAKVSYTLRLDTVAGEISYSNEAYFSKIENEEYRMQWNTNTIFPNLNPGDKVWVEVRPANRGCIYDRNGEMLAGPGLAFAVGFVPGKMRTEEALTDESADSTQTAEPVYKTEDIAAVAELLEMTPESILDKLGASYVKDGSFVLLRNISRESLDLQDALLAVKGIMITDTQVRYYPLGDKASHLVGYVQGISAEDLEQHSGKGYYTDSVLGKAGLEKIYEDQIRARDGYEIIIVDRDGNLKQSLAKCDMADGKDIVLTIDAKMQTELFDLFHTDKGCSVAMNPKTGEVLALVSTPGYDPNDFVLGMTSGKWDAMSKDEDQPFFNRFESAICPGSTMKAITAAIALNCGALSPEDDLGESGLKWQKDAGWGSYFISTTMEYKGAANVRNALKFSDNIFFAKTALKIGAERFSDELIEIGFNENIPFEYTLSPSSISASEGFSSDIQLADSGFGQGEILMNPVHLATVYSAFQNEGNMLVPRLFLGSGAKIWKENAFSGETANIILDDLIAVVESGNAKDAKVWGQKLGGKTGTADIRKNEENIKDRELGWFVEFTADDNEENALIVVSMVEDVEDRGGSQYLLPKVKTLFE